MSPIRVLLMSLVLLLVQTLAAASDSKSSTLFVSFRPEVALSSQGSSFVGLKIRLSDGASAQLWIADMCSSAPGSAYVIRMSGEYQIPLSGLGKTGTTACLSSTDGARAQVQLVIPVKEPIRCFDSTCSSL
jgi:hypothetical protein